MADSPESSLSSIASEEFTGEDIKFEDPPHSPASMAQQQPPSKRRRTGTAAWDRQTPISSVQEDIPPSSPTASISTDSSGELPNSPATLALLGGGLDDDYSGHTRDQVTACQWDGCDVGDLGNMDALVNHIHTDHISTKQKKYLCEWNDCPRKGHTHASGYALRAHMRSHTKEKPFYCTLPECDRSFTRSDALAKHMRTVHETEALRPSDPISKHHILPGASAVTTSAKVPRIKLKLSQPSKEGNHDHEKDDANNEAKDLEPLIPDFGPELGFDEHELSLEPEQLYRVLRRQIHWAEQEAARLKEDWDTIEPQRKESWKQKELIFDDVIQAETRALNAAYADFVAGPAMNESTMPT